MGTRLKAVFCHYCCTNSVHYRTGSHAVRCFLVSLCATESMQRAYSDKQHPFTTDSLTCLWPTRQTYNVSAASIRRESTLYGDSKSTKFRARGCPTSTFSVILSVDLSVHFISFHFIPTVKQQLTNRKLVTE